MCWTASARRKCCRRFCRTGRGRSATAQPESRSKAMKSRSSTRADAELPDGEIGELLVRGPSSGEGYWNQRQKSRRTFAGEWTHTGDKYLSRSRTDIISTAAAPTTCSRSAACGFRRSMSRRRSISHEAVLEAAVIPKEDTDGLIKPKAFVVLKNGLVDDAVLLSELKEHVKARAGTWKYPRWIELRTVCRGRRQARCSATNCARRRRLNRPHRSIRGCRALFGSRNGPDSRACFEQPATSRRASTLATRRR